MDREEFDLSNFRMTIGWTQTQLAEKLGVSQSTITSWENNPGTIPFNSMSDIARVTGYKLVDLLSFGEKQITRITDFTIQEESVQKRNELKRNYTYFLNEIEKWKQEHSKYNEYQEALDDLESVYESANIENQKLKVAFLGKSDAGKSTMINSLLGSEVSPSQWQPATSAVLKIMHIEDRPSHLIGSNTVIVRTSTEDGPVVGELLENQEFFDKHLQEQGDSTLISKYGLHNNENMTDESTMDTIFVYLDSPILKSINIIDTPGIATGEHTRGRKDSKASENTRREADVFVYLSVSNQFLHGEDQEYLKAILDILPPIGNNGSNQPFSNLFIVASQAHITGKLELEKVEGIYDKGLDSFSKVLPENYLESKGENYNLEALRSRFYSFSRDDHNLTNRFRDDFISFISNYSRKNADNVDEKYTTLLYKYTEEQEKNVDNLLKEASDLSESKSDLEAMTVERDSKLEEISHFVDDSVEKALEYSKASVVAVSKEYKKVINVDYITQLIKDRDFKNRKDDKEAIQNLVSNILNEKVQKINEKYTEEYSEFIDDQVETYQRSFSMLNFDFQRSFISILSAGVAGGALVAYMSTLGNLGGYILVAQIVSLLSSLGISVGGVAAAVKVISAIGGPVVLAIGLSILTGIAAYRITGRSWEKSFANKLVSGYEKQDALSQLTKSVEKYWEDTKDSMIESGDQMKESYDQAIKELETKLNQPPEYFYQSAELIKQTINQVKKWIHS